MVGPEAPGLAVPPELCFERFSQGERRAPLDLMTGRWLAQHLLLLLL